MKLNLKNNRIYILHLIFAKPKKFFKINKKKFFFNFNQERLKKEYNFRSFFFHSKSILVQKKNLFREN